MSNRDGRNGSKSQPFSVGSPCPRCKEQTQFKRRTEKTPKIPRLQKAYCNKASNRGAGKGHNQHVECPGCHWTNF